MSLIGLLVLLLAGIVVVWGLNFLLHVALATAVVATIIAIAVVVAIVYVATHQV